MTSDNVLLHAFRNDCLAAGLDLPAALAGKALGLCLSELLQTEWCALRNARCLKIGKRQALARIAHDVYDYNRLRGKCPHWAAGQIDLDAYSRVALRARGL